MAEPYIGEIRMGGWNFAPEGWAFCNGQLLNISDYNTLFALIGTTYGGDGQNTFGLPDLRGRVPIHQGNSGQGAMTFGQSGGAETVTVSILPPLSAMCWDRPPVLPFTAGRAIRALWAMPFSRQAAISPMITCLLINA